MANPNHIYPIERRITGTGLQYVFVSNGGRDIIKIIEYSFVQVLLNKDLFNLGFGDYDIDADELLDDPTSNNGDQYRVFNTVLNTIPDFFSHFPNALMVVQGSDSKRDFIERCKVDCKKKCGQAECKNAQRRIAIYRRYVESHYQTLSTNYVFYGDQRDIDNHMIIENYAMGKRYESVFVAKKILP